MSIIIGIVLAVVGVFMAIKSEAMLNMFGRVEFFEKYLGIEAAQGWATNCSALRFS